MKLLSIMALLLAWAWATPLLLQRDESERLEKSFLVSSFCKQYGCVLKQVLGNHRVYRVGKATIQVETMGAGNLIWLELSFPHPRKVLSPATLKLLQDFTRSALDSVPKFDYNLRCLQLSENPGEVAVQPQYVYTFPLKARTMQMWCLWDDGVYFRENKSPAKIRLSIGWQL